MLNVKLFSILVFMFQPGAHGEVTQKALPDDVMADGGNHLTMCIVTP